MPKAKQVKVRASAALNDSVATVTVKVCGVHWLRCRIWLGTHLIRLGARVIGTGSKIELVGAKGKTRKKQA